MRQLVILLTTLTSLVLMAGVPTHAANEDDFMEGVHYLAITPAQPTTAPKGKVEITEFFWYGCPHCFRFEPHLKAWLKSKPDYIHFTRTPPPLNPKWEIHSRVFYAAEAMGVIDKLHTPLFNAIHAEKKRLFDMESILDFVEKQGIDRKQFENAMKSFAVSSKVQYAVKLGRASKANGVPALIVNGKYLVDGRTAGDHVGMIYIANMLANKEYLAMQKENKTAANDAEAVKAQPKAKQ